MFYRIEILKGQVRQVISTHYRSGVGLAEVEVFAEGERKLHDGDGFRLCDLHTSELIEVGAVEVPHLEQREQEVLERHNHAALVAQLKASSAVIPPSVSD